MIEKTSFKKVTIYAVIVLAVLMALPSETSAQVSIAPTSLFFDSQNRFSSLTVSNGGQQAQEISINMEFGYPTTEDGNLLIKRDSILASKKSLAPWLKVFPQNFTLQPNQRQVVRFVTQPPQNLDPGGYWSRVEITSNPVSPPIEAVSEGQVGAQIKLVVNQVIAAHFHSKGAKTGVQVNEVDFIQSDTTQSADIEVDLEQTGNAPFIGSIQLRLMDSAGETVFNQTTTVSVYTTITRTFSIDTSRLDSGNYTLSGSIKSQRRDISQDNLLQTEPVNFEKKVVIE